MSIGVTLTSKSHVHFRYIDLDRSVVGTVYFNVVDRSHAGRNARASRRGRITFLSVGREMEAMLLKVWIWVYEDPGGWRRIEESA